MAGLCPGLGVLLAAHGSQPCPGCGWLRMAPGFGFQPGLRSLPCVCACACVCATEPADGSQLEKQGQS
jgi:hypothetical protein